MRYALKGNAETIAISLFLQNQTLGAFACPALLASSLPGRLAKARGEGLVKAGRKAEELTNEEAQIQTCA